MPTFTESNGKTPNARVAVVAVGIVSPLGAGLDTTLNALREARDCVSAVDMFDVDQCRCKTAGQVSDEWIADANGRRSRRLHRASRMMIRAMDEMLMQDRQFKPQLAVIGTTSGGMSFGQA